LGHHLLDRGRGGGLRCRSDHGVLLPTTAAAQVYGRSVEDGARLSVGEARNQAVVSAELALLTAVPASLPKPAAEGLQRTVDEHGDVPRYPVLHQIWNGRVVSSAWLRQMRETTRRGVCHGLAATPTSFA
jgi:hypothetical protein